MDLLPAQAMVTPARKIERLEKQTDMKVVAGARFEVYSAYSIGVSAVPATSSRRDETLCNVPHSRPPGEQAHTRPPASAG